MLGVILIVILSSGISLWLFRKFDNMNIPKTLLLIGAILAANNCKAAPNAACKFEQDINIGEIGPIKLKTSLDEIGKNYSIKSARLPYSDVLGKEVTICNSEATIIAETDASDNIITISTKSSLFHTGSGARVGMSLNQLMARHPDGILSTGTEEGGWITFIIKELSGYFEFSLVGVEFKCLQDNKKCPSEFYRRPAIRYWTMN